ncbi:MAG: class I SAM-dependent methyltransferase [Anaerolineae bacterium]|jgi:ubiquinone/menaquinone biosynthesis C-methylase UbiE
MFSEAARYYDKIYSFKDHEAESDRLTAIIEANLRSGGKRLLDVACGTGGHIAYLKQHFEVEGLDISTEFLEIARRKHPDVPFHHADMAEFDLRDTYDIVTCLFSSIGYLRTLQDLNRAVTCMTRHVIRGGLLIIEPWFTPETWHAPSVHADLVDEPELKIARVNTSFVDGRLSYFDLHYLIGTLEGTEHFVERHELGLFETAEVRDVLTRAGLDVTYDAEGLTDRGLFIGRRE